MNNNWEFDYSELYNNNNPGRNAQNTTAPEAESPLQGAPGPAGMPGMGVGGAPVPPHAAQKKRGWGKRVAAGAAAVVFCGAVGFGGGYLGYTFAKGGSTGPVIYQAPAASSGTGSAAGGTANTADALSVTEIASKVGPSVVEVTTEAVTTNAFFGQYVQSGAGSGVIITEDGYIITNNHVVSGASQVTVRTSDGTEYPATVVGADSKTDIAVLKIEATGLTPAVVGDSDSLQVGEFTLAVGNPLGELGGTVTDGIISALDREVTVENQTMNLLQTNAAVSPGNSGGPLVDAGGRLVGADGRVRLDRPRALIALRPALPHRAHDAVRHRDAVHAGGKFPAEIIRRARISQRVYRQPCFNRVRAERQPGHAAQGLVCF